jgi:hypothetical protein
MYTAGQARWTADLGAFVDMTDGPSGADLEVLCQQAKM